ncbi:beta-galactosidase [Kitasatospora herbaricolor]|uniref:beta-galactosidase n=1 Tax=Kitasatospora herbaricolor TaxID=68217 RepID=UPI0036DCBEE7
MAETDTTRTERLRRRLGGLAFGGDYNPEQWPEETRVEDLALMAEAGVNLVTVGVFAWSRVEPERDRFDFSFYDRLLDELDSHRITVDLATMTASPPPWLAAEHREILPVSADGTVLSPGGRQHFCPSSPVYRQRAARLVEEVATRYRGHPAVGLWHIGNEYGCHVAQCYCDNSAVDFRRWLRVRYRDIDALNEAWTTEVWSQRYTSFDQVLPPRTTPFVSNPAQQLDYKRFSDEALLACYEIERQILRRHTPEIPLTTNFMAGFKHVDQQAWAPRTDVASLDSYPDPNDPRAHVAAGLAYDTVRGARGGDPWLLMEQSTSAVNWRARNGAKKPGQMRLWSWQAVAHGADAVLFFQWRQSRGGSERFHSAMIPHAGPETRIFREVTALGREMAAVAGLAGTRVRNEIALLLDWDSWWALELDSHPLDGVQQMDRLLDCYGPLFDLGLGVDVVAPDADLSGYRLVIAPSLYLLSEQDGTRLTEWTRAGGHLFVTFFSGIVDTFDRVRLGGYPAPLRAALGISVEEFWPADEGESFPVRGVRGGAAEDCHGTADLWREDLKLEGAAAELLFDSRDTAAPAATVRTYGSGTARYLSTRLDTMTMRALLARAAAEAGVQPILSGLPDGVQAAVRHGEEQRYLILLNHTDQHHQVDLPEKWQDQLAPGKSCTDRVVLPPGGVAVLGSGPGD